jgi:CBS domain-containing protein
VQVSDVMTTASISDSPTDSLKAAAARMWEQQTGSLLVIEDDQLLGILTERDVMKAVARGLDLVETTVREIMTKDVQTIGPDTPLHEAARLMAARWIRHLPVMDRKGAVVGMVSQRDLVGVFAALVRDDSAVPLASDDLVREKRLHRIEAGDLD